MTAATSTPTTAPPSTRPPAPPGLRLQLDPTMAGTGVVDGGWWPRSRDRVALLVIPPQATTAAAGIAMAMAADATNGARPADILAAAGIVGEDPAPTSPGHSHGT
jgi:hypothetical protein